MNWLIKKLIPGPSKLAGYAAGGIAKAVNGSRDEVKEKVAAVARMAENATNIANQLSRMVMDGEINEMEAKDLQAMLTPLFEKVLGLI